jgi:hypothetical protein
MQGAWHLATGQALSFSEQQMVDCSWNYGNNGCQGGEMEPAIQVCRVCLRCVVHCSVLQRTFPFAAVMGMLLLSWAVGAKTCQ